MIYIISATNRPGSNSLKIAKQIQSFYAEKETEIIDLQNFPQNELNGTQYSENQPKWIQETNKKITQSDGLVVIAPEYNGSIPGVFKSFIDHLEYPKSFYHRPVCFIGLGGMFGGLRPVEHAQQIFGYRDAFIYPDRVFLQNVWSLMKDDLVDNPEIVTLLKKQANGFAEFVAMLKNSKLHASKQDS